MLKIAVAAYVSVIALMVAQAIGRALVSLWVLTSYYAAQILIVHNARPVTTAPTTLA